MKIKGAIREFLYLKKMHSENKLHGAFVSSMSFLQTLLYRMYGKLFSFPVILLYAEMSSAMQHRSGVVRRVNDYFFDNFLVSWMSGTLPISEHLVNNYKKIAPGKPFLKIPAICRFENFNIPKKKLEEPYFLFCGAFDYREVINFIIEAYQNVDQASNYKLYLIVSGGSAQQYQEFNQYLKERELLDKTKVFSNIPFSELVDHYVNATALLIPLRPTIQDIARFPHKISEYTATGNPIISTNYGEVKHYFKDGENALIAKTYDPSQFAEKMKYVVENPEQAKNIGLNGKELGKKYFNHLQYGPLLKGYLQGLIAKKSPK
jgi:glycosyltransferase involved in cell wall biosynthesis